MTISRVALHGVSSVRFAGDAAILAVTPDGLVRVTNDGKVTQLPDVTDMDVRAVLNDESRLAFTTSDEVVITTIEGGIS